MSYVAKHPRTGRILMQAKGNLLGFQPQVEWTVHRAVRPVERVRDSLIFVQASDGQPLMSPIGALPSNDWVRRIRDNFKMVVVMHHHLYRQHGNGVSNAAPPYRVVDPSELRRFNGSLLANNVVSLAYISPFNYLLTHDEPDWTWFLEHVRRLTVEYGFRGLYVDGLAFDYNEHRFDDVVLNRWLTDELRKVVGQGGLLVGHLSHGNHPAAFLPDVEERFTAVLKGEGYRVESLRDPYLQHEIATTRFTGVPVGWLYHNSIDRSISLDSIVNLQVEQGMLGVSFAHQKIVDDRYEWQDGQTSFWVRWWQRVND